LGNGWATQQSIHVVEDINGNVFVNLTANNALAFELVGPALVNYLGGQETLTHDTTNHLYVLTDQTGKQFEFYDYDAGYPALQKGSLKRVADPDGGVTAVTAHDSAGRITEVQRSRTVGGTTTTESYLTTYLTSGTNAGRASDVTLRRQVGAGSWVTVRK